MEIVYNHKSLLIKNQLQKQKIILFDKIIWLNNIKKELKKWKLNVMTE